jgi:tetratricopeptide (TPR) repeat protein
MGRLHAMQSRLESAQEEFESALGLYRAAENRRREGIVLGRLGGLLAVQGKPEAALEYLEAALEIHQETKNRRFEAFVLMDIGHLAHILGMEEEAVAHFEQALRLARFLGATMIEGAVRGNLGDLLLDQGNLEMAEHHLTGAIEICASTWPAAAAAFQGSLALLRTDQDHPTEARNLLKQAEACLRELESPELGKLLCQKGIIELRLGDPSATQHALTEAMALAESQQVSAESDLSRWLNTLREAISNG